MADVVDGGAAVGQDGVALAADHAGAQGGEGAGFDVGGAVEHAGVADHGVDAFGAQLFDQGGGGAEFGGYAHLRMVGGHVGQEGCQQQGGRGWTQSDGQGAGFAAGQALEFAAQFGFLVAHAAGALGDAGAVGRQAHLAGAAVQQRQAQFGFQRLDAAAERGLGQVDLVGGARKGAVFDHGEQVLEFLEVHVPTA